MVTQKKKKYEWKALTTPVKGTTTYKGYKYDAIYLNEIASYKVPRIKKKHRRIYNAKITNISQGGLEDLLRSTISRTREKMLTNIYKTNSFFEWVSGKESKEYIHYFDTSIALDFVLQTRERYYG